VNYDSVVQSLVASGSPVVLLICYLDIVTGIFAALDSSPGFDRSSMLFISVDAWTASSLSPQLSPHGMLGLAFYRSHSAVSRRFVNLWESLDPIRYPDGDGNRSTLATDSSFIIDAVFSLAIAYQFAINDATTLTGDLFRQHVFNKLADSVKFEGVSGYNDFNSYGDQVAAQWSIYNYPGYENNSSWLEVGFMNSTDIELTLPFVWPDGTSGFETPSYSSQFPLYCPAGMEPFAVSKSLLICFDCAVGYYKALEGSHQCSKCPLGASCDAVGLSIPCPEKGYWRYATDELSNFDKYPIFKCDHADSCLGGCSLNNSCSLDRQQDSPTCGVCVSGKYLSGGVCVDCTSMSPSLVWTSYSFQSFGFFCALLLILYIHIDYSQPVGDGNSLEKVTPLHQSWQMKLRRRLFLGIDVTVLSIIIPRTATTVKLCISFWQVMSKGAFSLDVNWTKNLRSLFAILAVNPLSYLTSTASCTSTELVTPYLILATVVLLPFVLILFLCIAVAVLYIFSLRPFTRKLREKYGGLISSQWMKNSLVNIWHCAAKVVVWFCLLFFAICAST
jgi:hypothetical protein